MNGGARAAMLVLGALLVLAGGVIGQFAGGGIGLAALSPHRKPRSALWPRMDKYRRNFCR